MNLKKSDWLKNADREIRNGNGSQVALKLKKLQKKGVPPNQIAGVAALANRVGLYQFATNILHRLIYQNPYQETRPENLAEYASSLSAVGNYIEAKEVFEQLPIEILKNYSSKYADALFRTWNYDKAKQVLEKLRPENIDNYKDLVFALNLSACFVSCGEFQKAQDLLEEIEKAAIHQDHSLILANAMELNGQVLFFQQEYEKSLHLFCKSEEMLRASKKSELDLFDEVVSDC